MMWFATQPVRCCSSAPTRRPDSQWLGSHTPCVFSHTPIGCFGPHRVQVPQPTRHDHSGTDFGTGLARTTAGRPFVKNPNQTCQHCRAPLPSSAKAGVPFCCSGCERAWNLLQSAGLQRYYELNDGTGTPGDADPRDLPWLPALLDLARASGQPESRLVLELDAQGLHCAG